MAEASYQSTRQALAARIKQRRAELGVSQEVLALEAGIDRTFVSQIERGVGNPSLRILCQLADRLGVPVAAMLSVDGIDGW
ncbi:helix-turn-helix domain-containing protein [Aquincola tertiaricarbonis]|uniref:Helix-turn-helix domain-containing protein n=1 Tax=Aquincola tertiaricarbonis TaxID=391953 RepID=A0ABY4S8X1_AQUTE|nr:helix-turn-helix transcriptional regulator [Aquincola tertiaricarbonis]URI09433.1 helix-turn-helix domain-containing protein [Aquincola tertiaricarbonis]